MIDLSKKTSNWDNLELEELVQAYTWNKTCPALKAKLVDTCAVYPSKLEKFFETSEDESQKHELSLLLEEQRLGVINIPKPEKPPDRDTKTLKPEQTFDTKSSESGKEMKFLSCGAPEDVDENGRLIFP